MAEIARTENLNNTSNTTTTTTTTNNNNNTRRAHGVYECCVCLSKSFGAMPERPCCRVNVCKRCMFKYMEITVSSGITSVRCLGTHCNQHLSEYEISSYLSSNAMKQKFMKFSIDARRDPTLKTCPGCGLEKRVQWRDLNQKEVTSRGLQVRCTGCALRWCFPCHAPWHEGLTCGELRARDESFVKWTRRYDAGNNPNVQRCPFCQIYIQRSSGCNSMLCPRCSTAFCYHCGARKEPIRRLSNLSVRELLFVLLLGDHNQRFTPLGCPGSLYPNSPLKRYVIKGVVLGCKVTPPVVLPIAMWFVRWVRIGVLVVLLSPVAAFLGVFTFVLLRDATRYLKRSPRVAALRDRAASLMRWTRDTSTCVCNLFRRHVPRVSRHLQNSVSGSADRKKPKYKR